MVKESNHFCPSGLPDWASVCVELIATNSGWPDFILLGATVPDSFLAVFILLEAQGVIDKNVIVKALNVW